MKKILLIEVDDRSFEEVKSVLAKEEEHHSVDMEFDNYGPVVLNATLIGAESIEEPGGVERLKGITLMPNWTGDLGDGFDTSPIDTTPKAPDDLLDKEIERHCLSFETFDLINQTLHLREHGVTVPSGIVERRKAHRKAHEGGVAP